MLRLDGKVALVTGASGAIGRDISVALAKAGADIVASGRDMDRLGETARLVSQAGRRAHALVADMARQEDVRRLAAEGAEKFGRLDILVNNAGTNLFKPAGQFTEEDFDLIVATNLKGPFFLSQLVAEVMKGQGGGNIIFITSQLGSVAMNFACLYGATKAALMQVTRSLAFEWARYNIRVNSVSPGPWSTGMLEPLFRDGKTKEGLIRQTPLRRLGGEGDLGGAVVFLVSDAARHITGQDLVVDGGFSICKVV
jgi:NAD(P)-dependent dehydrogenase (short-subunit alcohol dehydrogenase family)